MIFLTILITIVAVLLVLIVLIQNPKGGGLNSSFGGSAAANQIMGAANSGDMLEKGTWTLAGMLLALCLVTGLMAKGSSNAPDTETPTTNIENTLEN